MQVEISTDGGCASNPGPGGSGVFIEIKDANDVTVEEVSIYFSIIQTTNNRAEMEAVRIAFETIIKEKYTKALINVDSQYVLDPLRYNRLPKMKANDWESPRTGTPYKNVDLWKHLLDLYLEVHKVCDITYAWVKGHTGHYGNEHADDLATVGKTLAESGIEDFKVQRIQKVSETGEPIKLENFKKSPLLQSTRLYFHSRDKRRTDKEGRCIYYTGTHGKEDGDIGKRSHEAQHCVTLLKERDAVLDYIIEEHQSINKGKLGTVAIAKLDTACSSKKYTELRNALKNGSHLDRSLFYPLPKKNGLREGQGELVSQDISPPILGFTCLDTFYVLEQVLTGYLDGTAVVNATDLTDVLYDVGTVGKGKNEKVKYTLKKDITTSAKVLDLAISTPNDNRSIKLTLGHCLPTRNALSAIAKYEPKVTAITWSEGGRSFRLAFIMETTEGASLWTSFYSALYFTD